MPRIQAVLSDPSTSNWLHIALTAALKRDCVDAAKDAELLASLLSERAQSVLDQGSAERLP